MMPVSTITQKGQTTVPNDIRKHLGLKPGDKIRFSIGEDGQVILEAANLSIRRLKGILPPPKTAVTLEDMQDAIEAEALGW